MAHAAIPPEEVKVLDVNSSYLGVRTITLMEKAGEAVAKEVLTISKPEWRIAVVCGKGNNGGDGFVAARHIAERLKTEVFLVEPERQIESDIAKANLETVKGLIRPLPTFDPGHFDLIVDAMLGVGLKGAPREPYAGLIKLINRWKGTVVSVDVPSGWPSELSVRPDSTIALHAPKEGMTPQNSGRIVVVDIGIPPEAETFCGPGEFMLLPRRRKDAHKGDAGRVLVVGGGPYTGAPAFTGMSAMRSGVDLTFVATPSSVAVPVSIYSPNIIVRPIPGDVLTGDSTRNILEMSKKVDVMAIGPGLGNDPETLRAVQEIVKGTSLPLVIDADAIAACGAKPSVLRGKTGVITPHAGEFKKLTGKTVPEDMEERSRVVKEAARRLGLVILLKGPVDVISDGSHVKLNRVHNEAMTVGGTGDVLTGAVAAFIAQKASPFAAARMGAFACGLAGNLAFEERSFGLLATDVIDKIPLVLRRYL